MSKELIINSGPKGANIALLDNKRLVELHQEGEDTAYQVGDIYLGRVRKLVQGLNAAFVDVGHEKDGFLHYTDLGPNIRSMMKVTGNSMAGKMVGDLRNFQLEKQIVKTGNVKEVLKRSQSILVQVLKEPISTKGPRLTSEISLPGRYLVLVPFSDSVGVSRKIGSAEERKRLKIVAESIRPKNFGIVIRTVAKGKSVAQLHEDLQQLIDKWGDLVKNLRGAHPGKKILSELGKSSTILRDLLNDDFGKIVTNSKSLSNELVNFIEGIAPEKAKIVQTYNGKTPIFDQFHVTKQIKSLFGKNVSYEGGAYLVIEHTEAMHVIDVNSGMKSSMAGDQESNALQVNMGAAAEIARQLRLRDMGGIVLIDFIDMRNPAHKKEVYNEMRRLMKTDRAKHTILPLSKFNLMQITRQRVRPEVNISTREMCPTCNGTGKIEASILLVDDLEKNVNYILETHKSIRIEVHPFIEAFLRKGLPSRLMKWMWKHKCKINVRSNNNFPITEYKFYTGDDVEITL